MTEFYVEIVRYSDLEVVKRMGPMSERKANRVERGAMINPNYEMFFTRVVEEKAPEVDT